MTWRQRRDSKLKVLAVDEHGFRARRSLTGRMNSVKTKLKENLVELKNHKSTFRTEWL